MARLTGRVRGLSSGALAQPDSCHRDPQSGGRNHPSGFFHTILLSLSWKRRDAPGLFSNRARQVCRARIQRPRQNRPVAAFNQAATGRARNSLARGTASRCPLARARF